MDESGNNLLAFETDYKLTILFTVKMDEGSVEETHGTGEMMAGYGNSTGAKGGVSPDSLWIFSVNYAYLSLLVLGGTVGNLCSICVLCDNRTLRKASVSQYLIALAVSDVVYLLDNSLNVLQYYFLWDWPQYTAACQIQHVCSFFINKFFKNIFRLKTLWYALQTI